MTDGVFGVDREGKPKPDFQPGIELVGKYVFIADEVFQSEPQRGTRDAAANRAYGNLQVIDVSSRQPQPSRMVSIRTGIRASSGSDLSACSTVQPSIPGISTSSVIALGRCARACGPACSYRP